MTNQASTAGWYPDPTGQGVAFKTIKSPKVALTALGSSIGTEVLYGAGFAMCVLAVGGNVSLGEAVVINVTVSLFAGLMPIPGGVGVGLRCLTKHNYR